MDNDIFGGFEALADGLSNSGKRGDEGAVIIDGKKLPSGNDPMVPPPGISEEEEEEEEDLADLYIPADESEEEEDDIDKDLNNTKPKSKTKTPVEEDDEDVVDFGEDEPELAEYVQEKLFERFGIAMDGDDFKKFESFDDITNFIEEAIKVNSIPEFANEEVEAIDEYVRNGGSLNTFMAAVHGGLDLNNADLSNENIQKSIIMEDLKNQGLSETRIKRKIERMEDTGMLEEEATDSLESLKEYRAKSEERLLQSQQKAKQDSEKANLTFLKGVEKELEGMDNVRGIPLTTIEKKQLYNYMLKPTAAGVPQYHIDYRSNQKNMIESAYFTMKGDKLIQKVEKKASSLAAKKLKTKLADKGKRGKDQSTPGSGSTDVWSMLSNKLR